MGNRNGKGEKTYANGHRKGKYTYADGRVEECDYNERDIPIGGRFFRINCHWGDSSPTGGIV